MTRRLTKITNRDDQFHQTYEAFDSAWRVSLIGGNASTDAFARLRVSTPLTLFDSKQIHDNQPLFWDDQETTGTGTTSVHNVNTASTTISVGELTAGTRVRQTFQRFNYQPGKSQLVLMTGTLEASGGGAGVKRLLGLFDESNGIFLRDNEGIKQVVIRGNMSGIPSEHAVDQDDWNIDSMDGNGESQIIMDFTKSQILIIDFEWLGVGTVRIGFVINGQIFYVHKFHHANLLKGVYMSTPNLPLRYEVSNDGTGDAASLEHICTSIISEGGQETNGVLRHTDSGVVSNLQAGTKYALLGIRLKDTSLDATVLLENLSLISTTQNDQFHWEIDFNPSVSGTFTYVDQTNSSVQIASGGVTNIVTGGTAIDGGFVTTSIPVTPTVPNALRLGASISEVPDEIVLCVVPITNNISVDTSITWREVS